MGFLGPVDAVDKLGRHEVAQVLHTVGCGVYVVVAPFSVVAEAVGVLHSQVQTLQQQQMHEQLQSGLIYGAALILCPATRARGALVLLTGSMETSTDWQMSGALTSKCLSQLLTSSSELRGQAENSLG